MKSKGNKSVSPAPKSKANLNDMTAIGKDISSKLDNKASNILLANPKTPANNKEQILKIFKGLVASKSGKNISVLQDYQWEYTIVLPNPDFPGRLNQAVTLEIAENFYKECFKAKKTGSLQKDTLSFLQESQAFLEAYNSLNDIDNGKALYGGQKMTIEGENCYDNGTPAKDFMTLVRNALFYKLVCSLGLKVKQLTSKNGEFLYFVVTADENDLMIEAERTRFDKQLEIALSDMQSLIPCDEYLRPLHILKNDDPEIKRLYKEIKPFLTRAFGLQKNVDKVEYKLNPNGVTPNMWNAYKIFLSLLKDGISKITGAVSSHAGQMFLFQKLVKDSIEKANLGFRNNDSLKNLWTRMSIGKPIAPFAEYRRSNKDDELGNMWRTHEISESGKRSLFRNMERIRLLVSYIRTEISINFLQERGFIEAHFPLHNIWQLKGKSSNTVDNAPEEDRLLRNILYDFKPLNADGPLLTSWRTALINQHIPLSKIRNYYGEKIALYFEFLRYHQSSLLIPALLGIGVFVIQRIYNEKSTQVLALNAFYSVFMTIWATSFLEGWKRKEAGLSVTWGTTKFEQVEIPRPQYKGIKRRSPVTDELEEIYYPESKRIKFLILAVTVSLLIISLVLSIVAGLIILKSELADDLVVSSFNLAGPVCSVLNAIQILVFNFIYQKLAKIMTDFENHKTENQYQDSYIWKVFAFQFVNSFNSLVYIAFIKGYVGEGCLVTQDDGSVKKGSNCMNELFTQLVSIFVVSYIKNLVEIGVPFIKYQMKKRKRAQSKIGSEPTNNKDIRTKIESQLLLEDYMTVDKDGTIDDYMELAIQFGYMTLFALAFPLSSALAFFGLWFEMQTDKLKILHLVRRPLPLSTKDIGTWSSIFSIISVLAIFSNTALFCFTSGTFDQMDGFSEYTQAIFGVIVVLLLLFRSVLQNAIPDISQGFSIVVARHDFVVEKVLRGESAPLDNIDEEVLDTGIYFSSLSEKMNPIDLV